MDGHDTSGKTASLLRSRWMAYTAGFRPRRRVGRFVICLWILPLILCLPSAVAQAPSASEVPPGAVIVQGIEGTNVWALLAGPDNWVRVSPQNSFFRPGTEVRVGEWTRMTLMTPKGQVVRITKPGYFQVPEVTQKSAIFRLLEGFFYIFHRGEPTDLEIVTRSSSATILGTEFVVVVDGEQSMTVRLLDGEVELGNEGYKPVRLTSGEEGVAVPGQPPTKRKAALSAVNIVQWFLYYPAVLDTDELSLTEEERTLLKDSLAAYGQGDVLAALTRYPGPRHPQSAAVSVYLGALLLAVGQVDDTEALLAPLLEAGNPAGAQAQSVRLARALQRLMAAVKGERLEPPETLALGTEWLAESYYRQAHASLEEAREAAREAVHCSPRFGFALARLAELEFGFVDSRAASRAVAACLQLTPRNAQAWTMEGFLLAGRNDMAQALNRFEEAIRIDPGLANAWLGRGLCRIRLGQMQAGLRDLTMAAALEPQRAVLRSYLGKALEQSGDRSRARHELTLAKHLDPSDPTAWLYSALLNQQNNRINEAIADLEKSKELNRNRRVYRSELAMDQDQAVRGANLATIYQDAGLTDVSVREAANAVALDYANYSAHLFLANSYNQLRDPNQVNLRYETAWLNEYLIANLLAPVGAGTLSQTVSQEEYSKLFEQDRLGVVSSTEYLSRGDWLQSGAQYGVYRNFAYALDASYWSRNGQRKNNDFEQTTLSLQTKQQVTAQDSVFVQAIYYNAEGGDLAQVYDPTDTNQFNPGLRMTEKQEPLLLLGYHHQWSPQHHTLLLGGRFDDTLKVTDSNYHTLMHLKEFKVGDVLIRPDSVTNLPSDLLYQSELEIYSIEGQHIWQSHPYTLVVGTRYQDGEFDTRNQLQTVAYATTNKDSPGFDRFTAYAYAQREIPQLAVQLIAGVSYDRLTYPVNHRYPPISDDEDREHELSPKVGLIWTPRKETTIRAAYAHALGGVSFDQSFRLEPSQVAGHNQAFRSVIPESVAGSSVAPEFDLWAVELDERFPSRTYLAIKGELLKSDVDSVLGNVEQGFVPAGNFFVSIVTNAAFQQHLDYEEETFTATLHQLVGDEWAFGSSYRFSYANLKASWSDIPDLDRENWESSLHQVRLFALFNHPCGMFAQFDSLWSQQSNHGYEPDRPGDDFWQHNAYVGYRFPRRHAEFRLGLLNITDQDYQLNPLNLTAELPRDRTVVTSLSFNF